MTQPTTTRTLTLWGVLAIILVLGTITGLTTLGLAFDDANAAERRALTGPEISFTDATYITSPPGFDDLLIGCHDGLRITMTRGGGNVPSNITAVLDETGCPR